MRLSKIPEHKLLPYETIVAATQGDEEALNLVLKHFEGYIRFKSTRLFYDEYGQTYRCVDQELRERIESKLKKRIVTYFRIV